MAQGQPMLDDTLGGVGRACAPVHVQAGPISGLDVEPLPAPRSPRYVGRPSGTPVAASAEGVAGNAWRDASEVSAAAVDKDTPFRVGYAASNVQVRNTFIEIQDTDGGNSPKSVQRFKLSHRRVTSEPFGPMPGLYASLAGASSSSTAAASVGDTMFGTRLEPHDYASEFRQESVESSDDVVSDLVTVSVPSSSGFGVESSVAIDAVEAKTEADNATLVPPRPVAAHRRQPSMTMVKESDEDTPGAIVEPSFAPAVVGYSNEADAGYVEPTSPCFWDNASSSFGVTPRSSIDGEGAAVVDKDVAFRGGYDAAKVQVRNTFIDIQDTDGGNSPQSAQRFKRSHRRVTSEPFGPMPGLYASLAGASMSSATAPPSMFGTGSHPYDFGSEFRQDSVDSGDPPSGLGGNSSVVGNAVEAKTEDDCPALTPATPARPIVSHRRQASMTMVKECDEDAPAATAEPAFTTASTVEGEPRIRPHPAMISTHRTASSSFLGMDDGEAGSDEEFGAQSRTITDPSPTDPNYSYFLGEATPPVGLNPPMCLWPPGMPIATPLASPTAANAMPNMTPQMMMALSNMYARGDANLLAPPNAIPAPIATTTPNGLQQPPPPTARNPIDLTGAVMNRNLAPAFATREASQGSPSTVHPGGDVEGAAVIPPNAPTFPGFALPPLSMLLPGWPSPQPPTQLPRYFGGPLPPESANTESALPQTGGVSAEQVQQVQQAAFAAYVSQYTEMMRRSVGEVIPPAQRGGKANIDVATAPASNTEGTPLKAQVAAGASGVSLQQEPPQTGTSSTPCKWFVRGTCKFGAECRFLHAPTILPPGPVGTPTTKDAQESRSHSGASPSAIGRRPLKEKRQQGKGRNVESAPPPSDVQIPLAHARAKADKNCSNRVLAPSAVPSSSGGGLTSNDANIAQDGGSEDEDDELLGQPGSERASCQVIWCDPRAFKENSETYRSQLQASAVGAPIKAHKTAEKCMRLLRKKRQARERSQTMRPASIYLVSWANAPALIMYLAELKESAEVAACGGAAPTVMKVIVLCDLCGAKGREAAGKLAGRYPGLVERVAATWKEALTAVQEVASAASVGF